MISPDEKEFKDALAPQDVQLIASYMVQLRTGGLTPSDAVKRGLDAAERYVDQTYPQTTMYWRLRYAAFVWEDAAKRAGIHAGQRKAASEVGV